MRDTLSGFSKIKVAPTDYHIERVARFDVDLSPQRWVIGPLSLWQLKIWVQRFRKQPFCRKPGLQ